MRYIKENKLLIISILSISIPAIIEMSLNTLVGIFDTIMVSKLIGTDALSAAGFANQIIFTILFIFTSFNAGATIMISRSFGEKNYSRLNKVLGQNLSINIIIGFIITVLCLLFSKQLIGIFDTSKEVYDMGVDYLSYISFSEFFMFISFALAASMRGVGDTKTPMIITGIVNILNILGNYALITGFSIFPEMGIKGAALSTTISRAIGALIYIVIIIKGSKHLKLIISNLKPTRDILSPLWRFSSTAGLEQFLFHSAFFAMGIIISLLDTTSEASFRILLTIESTSFMPAVGFSIASAALVGKALGERDYEKSLHTGYISIGLGIVWGIFIGLVFVIFSEFIIKIFSSDLEVIKLSIIPLYLAGLLQPFLSFSIIISGSLRGSGDTKTIMLVTALRQWVLFIPLTYVLVKYLNYGIKSVYIAELISLIIINFVLFLRFHRKKWMHIKV